MASQARAILWAQIRTIRNFYPRAGVGRAVIPLVMSLIWYGLWSVGAVAVGILLASTSDTGRVSLLLSRGLMVALLYWQLVPVLMVSTGTSLDLKRLLIYPIPHRQLFFLEVLLRFSTGVEMVLVLAGAAVGLIANPVLPFWAPLGFAPFVVVNLLLAAGLKTFLVNLLSRKYIREIGFLLLMLFAVLPQFLVLTGLQKSTLEAYVPVFPSPLWLWNASAAAVLGEKGVMPWLIMLFWVGVAYGFGRWQFERSLRFDNKSAQSGSPHGSRHAPVISRFWRVPGWLLQDPLGAIVEKEVRFLSRSPRFRVVFLMGFTFGLVVWLPIAFQGSMNSTSFLARNYLTLVSAYALFLLGEVTFWNSFGFDRTAAQVYFLVPVSASRVLIGKNLAAIFFVLLDVTAVAGVCLLLGMPFSPGKVTEAYLVVGVLALYLLAAGNLGSTRHARPMDPKHAWRSTSAGRFQAMMLLVYPVVSIPVILAFLIRYLFDSELAFFTALGCAATAGGALYWMALQSAVKVTRERREELLSALSAGRGPISS